MSKSCIPNICITNVNYPHIVMEEKRSKITFQNPSRKTYQKIKVDGCVFSADDGEKCDWLLQSNEFEDQYFVELKGSDSLKAESQIAATIEKLHSAKKDAKCMAFIICANHSPKIDTNRQALEKKYNKNNIKLLFKESGYSYTLER